ncbi:cobalamin biosynthesis family protein [Vibrio renipiscarius]|uniref:Adenosylcobinamide-phosphate synthase n=1 Tax=Vibrio renipiscarius TaxID=1461322 RepID=A0A0C2P0H2_9VIBR|nr:cobalamin biosynthesis family protein [Vibrio renipiscarius]KII79952.1 adenosylcobinamide-phosphate synthase [Vibrio renipiscarius]KII80074.1 adenosylcobinamide-phosphate synthase [Vibrio renipiscarius]
MDDFVNSLLANSALLVMWGALLCHWVLPLPREVHPALLWHKFAEQLANKVNTQSHYSQSLLSGSFAWLLMLTPMLIVLLALQNLVWQALLFDLAFLMLALDWRNTHQLANQLIPQLANEDKNAVKQQLTPWLNRSTDRLSLLGLGKASSETLIMSYGRSVVAVLFWYAVTGGIGAFLYRMAMELARAWSPSRQCFMPFGLPAVRILAVLDFIPLRLFALLVACGKRGKACLTLIAQQATSWPLPGPAWLLVSVGAKLQLSLAGPAIYQHHKALRAKLGGRIAPSAIHVDQINKLLFNRLWIWVTLQSLLLAAIYQGL